LRASLNNIIRKIGETMETNPYEYDTTVPWRPQQNQLYEGRYANARTGQIRPPVLQNQRSQPGNGKPRPPEKMPKARALALAHRLKRWLAVASVVSFGTFSGLVAFHHVGSTTTASQSTSSQSSAKTSSSNSSSQNSSSFLKQKGGNNLGSSSSSQASTSGSSSSSQTPVSGTHTS
jgi:hypothetical protein